MLAVSKITGSLLWKRQDEFAVALPNRAEERRECATSAYSGQENRDTLTFATGIEEGTFSHRFAARKRTVAIDVI